MSKKLTVENPELLMDYLAARLRFIKHLETKGWTNAEIAEQISMSPKEIETTIEGFLYPHE